MSVYKRRYHCGTNTVKQWFIHKHPSKTAYACDEIGDNLCVLLKNVDFFVTVGDNVNKLNLRGVSL
jgi:hypothetical protein